MDIEAVNLAAGIASCCVYLLFCCSGGLAWARGAARTGRGLRGCAGLLCKQLCSLGRFDPQARSMMERERVTFAKQHAGRLAPLVAYAVVMNGLRSLTSNSILPPSNNRHHHDNILVAFLLVTCVFIRVFPERVTSRFLHSCFAMVCLWPVCLPLAGLDVAQRTDNMIEVSMDVFKRFFLQALVGANTINPKAACTMVMLQGVARSGIIWLQDDGTYCYIGGPAFDIVLALAMCLWIVSVELRFLGVARCSLETFEMIELRLLCLLYALYDVVVTLDTELRVAARAPKLDLLLNMRDAQGTHLADFMGATDRARFLEFVARPPPDVSNAKSNPAPAQSLNVHLQDGRGSWMQVQLFHTQFQNFGSNQVEHLIGICEVGDSGGRAAGGDGNSAGISGISVGRESLQAGTSTSIDALSTTYAYEDQDSDCSLIAGDSASRAGTPSRPTRDPEDDEAELPEQVDRVAPLRGEAEDRPAGFPRQQSTQQVGEVSITFDTLRFTIRQPHSGNPVVDASLLTHESLQSWVAGWWSCRAWMQDFVNAILRPVNSDSWPPSAGPPSTASFRVAFRGSCRLPPDILSRSGVPCSPPAGLSLPGGGAATSAERRRSHPADGDGAAPPAGSGPPVRLKVSRVNLSRHRRDERPSRNHSRERVSPSPPAPRHGGALAVAPQRGRFAQDVVLSRRADPESNWQTPAPASIGAAQSLRESIVDSRGESESFKDSCEEESEPSGSIQI